MNLRGTVYRKDGSFRPRTHNFGNGHAIEQSARSCELRYRARRLRDAREAIELGVSERFEREDIPAYVIGNKR